jgi:hypothetical protein
MEYSFMLQVEKTVAGYKFQVTGKSLLVAFP